jgi:hypothetical protein
MVLSATTKAWPLRFCSKLLCARAIVSGDNPLQRRGRKEQQQVREEALAKALLGSPGIVNFLLPLLCSSLSSNSKPLI